MVNRFLISFFTTFLLTVLTTSLHAQNKGSARELKRLNAKIERVRQMIESLELDNKIL